MLSRNTRQTYSSFRRFASGQGSSAARSDHFARVQPEDLAVFRNIVGEGVVTDISTLRKANRDWIGKYEGKSEVLLQPQSVTEVAAVLQHCNKRRLAVVPQGGNTGLVGGSVPVFDEIILSVAKLNQIQSMDAVSGALVAGAGCTLQQCDDAAAEAGCIMPLDLGPRAECQVGGNVSSNAGGLRVVRYGSLHGSVLGIQAVLPDGTILEDLATLKKDNTGYDLKQLFIGAEGTLGVVTGVAVECPPRSSSRQLAVLAVTSFPQAQQLLRMAKAALGEILSAFEFLDQQALQLTLEHLPEATDPLPGQSYPLYVLLETSGSNSEHDHAKLQAFTKQAGEAGLAAAHQVAQDPEHMQQLWGLRTGISVALRNAGPVYKYDFSMPLPQIYDLVEATRSRLAHLPATVVSYGHLGDGNLHLNISTQQYSAELEAALEPWVYRWVADRGGSISAEHGLGQMKNHMLGYTKPEPMVRMMAKIKQVFDPQGIMNPYKLLP